jgi:hypothetical protein
MMILREVEFIIEILVIELHVLKPMNNIIGYIFLQDLALLMIIYE